MNLHIIYTTSEMLLSKKEYKTWHEIQDEFFYYKTSLGPWKPAEVEAYLKDEYPKIYPSAGDQLFSFITSSNMTHIITFKNSD